MATATKVSEVPATGSARISLDEYLRTTYRPDVEYLNGELREKAGVGFAHGETQGFLFQWFSQHYQEWNIRCALEARVQVSPTQVRLPDVVVIAAPERTQGALENPPLIAIEVLSPADTYLELKARAADLAAMGVPNIWLIDEQARTAEVWAAESWHLQKTTRLEAVNSPVYLDLSWLWQQLDQ